MLEHNFHVRVYLKIYIRSMIKAGVSLETLGLDLHVRPQSQAQNRDLVLDIPQFVMDNALLNPNLHRHLGHSNNVTS
jgi:hypothetical protein